MKIHFILILSILLSLPHLVLAQNTEIPLVSVNSSVESPLEPESAAPVVPMVTVEARVVQIVLNDEHRDGVDWEAIVSDFHSLQLRKEGNPIWSDKKYKLSIGEVSNEDYEVLLDALDTIGHISQGTFPPMTLKKGESKLLDVSPDVNSLPTIGLNLQWFTTTGSEEQLKIEPSIGVTIKDSSQPGLVVTLKSQTEVDFKDSTTVVIGGLMFEEEITKIRKFPLLGDIPLLGLVFRKQGKLMQKTETIVFVSMHTNPEPIPVEKKT